MIDDTLLEAEEKMEKAVSVAKDDFTASAPAAPTPSMFNKILRRLLRHADAGEPAGVLPRPRRAHGHHHAVRQGLAGAIEKAIRDSDLGVNPTNDGTIIRVVFPQLTEERRKEYIKVARTKAEDARISIRNVRRHAKDDARQAGEGRRGRRGRGRRAEKELDEVTHKYVAEIDELLKHKEAELLEV